MPLEEKDLQKYFNHLDGEIKAVGKAIQPFMKSPDQQDRLTTFMDALGMREPDANRKLIGELTQVSRAAHVAYTMTETSRSIIETVGVFRDPESSPQERASAVLKCFGSFSQICALGGPTGLAVGTTISCLLGMISMILEATSPERETMIEKFENLVRTVQGEEAAQEVAAARDMFELQESAVATFAEAKCTWKDMMGTAPLTSDIATFALHSTAHWLTNPANFGVDHWEEIFVGYCRTLEEVFALYTTVLSKLVPADRKTLLAVSKTFGEHVVSFLEKVGDHVSNYGEFWHIGEPKPYGYRGTNFEKGNWSDSDIGALGAILLSPRGNRMWVYDDAHAVRTTKLRTDGTPGGAPQEPKSTLRGCTDLALIAGSSGDAYHVVAVQGLDPNGKEGPYTAKVFVNQWREASSSFASSAFVERTIVDSSGHGGNVVMARPFLGRTAAGEPVKKLAYVVRKNLSTSALFFVEQDALLAATGTVPSTRITHLPAGANHFRIAVSDQYVYLITDQAIWRKRHDDIIADAAWTSVTLPNDARMVMDVSTWSDVGLVAILDRGLWSVELETEPKAGTSSVSGDWKKCKNGSGVRMLKREHESAEYYDRLLAIAEGYVEGTALRS